MGESEANIDHDQKYAFEVSKWFFDVVTDGGICSIGYAATLKYKGICVPYSSLLISEPGKNSSLKSSFKKVDWPVYTTETVKWDCKNMGVRGVWQQQGESLKDVLFSSDAGSLEWHCLQSYSKVIADVSNMQTYNGRGYVEHLKMSVLPWYINIQQLRWGHFFTKSMYGVWIDFKGGISKRWVWIKGKQVEASVLNDYEIVIPQLDFKMQLVGSRELEKGKKMAAVVKKLFRFIPGFNKMVPDTFLKAEETKWLSVAQVFRNGLLFDEGWAVHELVDFTKC